MIEIKIEEEKLIKALREIQEKVSDMSPLMKNISEMMHDAVEKNFMMQGRPKWVPLKPSTIKQREKKGYVPISILKQTAHLLSSISTRHDSQTAVVGSISKYAAIHQFGGKTGRGHKAVIPPRPYLKLTPEDIEEIKERVIKYLNDF